MCQTCVSSGGEPTPAGRSVFIMWTFFMHTQSVKLKHNGMWGSGIYGLNGWGSYDKLSYCFFWKICSKTTGLQGSTLSGPHMTTHAWAVNVGTIMHNLYVLHHSLVPRPCSDFCRLQSIRKAGRGVGTRRLLHQGLNSASFKDSRVGDDKVMWEKGILTIAFEQHRYIV